MSGEISVEEHDETRPASANDRENSLFISVDRWLVLLLGVITASAFFLPTESGMDAGSELPRTILIMLLGAVAFWSFGQRNPVRVEEHNLENAETNGLKWIDFAVIGFLLFHSASVILGVLTGGCEPKPAINMLWQQLSFGVLYGSARLVLRRNLPIARWQTVVIACGVIVCLYAWYQFLIGLPALHQSYLEASPQQQIQMLMELGVTDTSPDSRMRQLTESRLFNREPFGFFALANSLAGLLVPLVLMTFAGSWTALLRRNWSRFLIWGTAWLFLSSTLALTSSRTGIVTVSLLMAGYVVWQFTKAEISRTVGWLLAIGALSLPIGLAILLWVSGASDGRLLSSAPATLRYRMEYWLSSSRMIQDFPLLGCGPGSFQSCYAKYQLPSASETISDPHNFMIEWMATAGLPAGLFLLAAITGSVLGLVRLNRKTGQDSTAAITKQNHTSNLIRSASLATAMVAVAPVIGVIAGWLFGFSPDNLLFVLVGLLIGMVWFAIAWANQMVVSQQQSEAGAEFAFQGSVLAWLGLMLHLSASGGINYGAIGQFFFILLAVVVSRIPIRRISFSLRFAAFVSSAVMLMSGVYLYYFQLSPMVKSSALMSRLSESRQMGQADRLLNQVLNVDPYNSEAAFALATLQLKQDLPRLSDPAIQKSTEKEIHSAMSLEPYSSPARADLANQYLMLIEQETTTANRPLVIDYLKRQAMNWLEAASNRKPTDSRLLAIQSWLFWSVGDVAQALKTAKSALELDAVVQHEDLKLSRVSFFVPTTELRSLQDAGFPLNEATVQAEANGAVMRSNQINAESWCNWINE